MKSRTVISMVATLLVFAVSVQAQVPEPKVKDVKPAATKEPGISAPAVATINRQAPEFELPDSSGKKKHKLSDFRGKYVVLEWTNYDCPFVKKHYRSGNMQKLQAAMKKHDVVWLTVCSSANGKQGYYEGEELAGKIKAAKINATAYLVDADGKVGRTYQARRTPHVYVIEPKGTLIYMGAIDDDPGLQTEEGVEVRNYVKDAITAHKKGEAVRTPMTKSYG